MGTIRALLVLSSIFLVSFKVESCIIAQDAYNKGNRLLKCAFSVSDVPNTTQCDTNLRQVFRLLDVNDEYVLVGSTECLYALTPNLEYEDSESITHPSSSSCNTLGYGELTDFMCQNYISNWFNEVSGPTSFRVCGTYDALNPRCWQCSYNMGLSCDIVNFIPTESMPTDPVENVTAITTEDGSKYFIGGLRNYRRPSMEEEYQIGKVDVSSGNEEVVTAPNEDQVMYSSVDFVGEPIEHGNFIYFFFRERALENYLQPNMIYSRVARVCKNDTGGVSNPLSDDFTTYLKARLMCSCGNDFPMIYNEIQDIDVVEQGNDKIIYGLFTTPNTKVSSSSAICRYSLTEIETLFNNDNRRGPTSANHVWSMRRKEDYDSAYKRENCGQYTQGNYDHLLDFPLLNTNVPNCGLNNNNCSSYGRESDNALAVFDKIRGQQLVVSSYSEDESSNGRVQVYIGTNNRQVLEVNIDTTQAVITEVITLRTKNMSSDDINAKWPYGISSLRIHNGVVYGNTDNCVFGLPDYPYLNITGLVIKRNDSSFKLADHTMQIEDAVTNFFTMFDAPIGVTMVPHFSELFDENICDWERFEPHDKEVLHVSCKITSTRIREYNATICDEVNPTLTGIITIVSGESSMVIDDQPKFEMNFAVDCTDIADNADTAAFTGSTNVKDYDARMAMYRYGLTEWYKNDVYPRGTCTPANECCYP